MIKASGKVLEGALERKLMVLGLSRRNTELLLQGKPISFDAKEIGIDCRVVILGGETETDLYEDIRVLGPITALTDTGNT